MKKSSDNSYFGIGVIVGAVVGGATAVILSSQKNRDAIRDSWETARKTWKKTNGDAQATLEAVFGDSFAEGSEYYYQAKDLFDTSVAKTKIALADLKEKDFKDIIDDIEKKLEKTSDTSWKDQLRLEWEKAKNK